MVHWLNFSMSISNGFVHIIWPNNRCLILRWACFHPSLLITQNTESDSLPSPISSLTPRQPQAPALKQNPWSQTPAIAARHFPLKKRLNAFSARHQLLKKKAHMQARLPLIVLGSPTRWVPSCTLSLAWLKPFYCCSFLGVCYPPYWTATD